MAKKSIPVILHTDLGTDIDDSWALLMLLRQKQLKPLMVLSDTGDAAYRAAIAARILETAGRTEVEVGIGCSDDDKRCVKTLGPWMKSYDIREYPGKVHEDGAARAVEIIRASKEPVTLISIGPCPAVAKMLAMAPEITGKVNFVGMFGSVYLGYNGKPGRCPEYNVYMNQKASKKVLQAPWLSSRITPLDTCGLVKLNKEFFAELTASKDKDVKLLMDAVAAWRKFHKSAETDVSSILFDTVAVHMASSLDYLYMQEIPLLVDKKGQTVPNCRYGRPTQVAVGWKDLNGYYRFLVDTLLGKK